MPNNDRDFRISTVSNAGCGVGLAIVAMSLVVSLLAAPYLFPRFQLWLVPPILVAAVLGSIGGLCRAWWLTGLMWVSVLALPFFWDDLPSFLGRALNPDLVNYPVTYYFNKLWTEEDLYLITVIPLTLGVAVLIHGWIAMHQWGREEARVKALAGVGLGVGALLGVGGVAAIQALTAVCEGKTLRTMEILVFAAAFGIPVGAAFGGLTGAIVGILRRREETRAALPQPADLSKYQHGHTAIQAEPNATPDTARMMPRRDG
jgi:hypothetical protein